MNLLPTNQNQQCGMGKVSQPPVASNTHFAKNSGANVTCDRQSAANPQETADHAQTFRRIRIDQETVIVAELQAATGVAACRDDVALGGVAALASGLVSQADVGSSERLDGGAGAVAYAAPSPWRDEFRHARLMDIIEAVETWRSSTGYDRHVARVDGLCAIWNFKRQTRSRWGIAA